MDKKCSKYEGLFIFSDDETLKKHVAECEECSKEHEKMQKVSDLIGEVKFYYKSKSKKRKMLKVACAFFLLMLFGTFFGIIANDDEYADLLMYGNTLSAEDLGFPVDSYGLLMVDE